MQLHVVIDAAAFNVKLDAITCICYGYPMEQPGKDIIEAWAGLIRVSQHLLAQVERDLRQADFPPLAWYDVLLELSRAKMGALRPYELQQTMLLAQYNLSRLLERMVEAGYVERRVCPSDKRGQYAAITDSGKALLRDMWPVYADALQRHVGAKLTEREATTLTRLLGKLKPAESV